MFTALLEKMHFPVLCTGKEKEIARLFHGRGFCYPEYQHINIDWLSPVILIILYKEKPRRVSFTLAIYSPTSCVKSNYRTMYRNAV